MTQPHLRVVSPLRPGHLVEETRTGRIVRLTEPFGSGAGWYGTHKGSEVALLESGILPVDEALLQHLLRAKGIAAALDEHGIASELSSLLMHTERRLRGAVDGPIPATSSQAGLASFEPHIVRGLD